MIIRKETARNSGFSYGKNLRSKRFVEIIDKCYKLLYTVIEKRR